jgi:hypothetical protein
MIAAVLIIAVAIFAAGVAAGIIAVVSLGSRREERQMSLNRAAPDQLTKAARLLTGLHVSHPSSADAARPDARVPQR